MTSKEVPFHLGNLPASVPNKVSTSVPNPPLSLGTVVLITPVFVNPVVTLD